MMRNGCEGIDMKRFLALYIGSVSSAEKEEWKSKVSEEKQKSLQKEGIEAWGNWVSRHKESVKDYGAPLGETMVASRDGVGKKENKIVSYVIVEAETLEEAAKMFENHPHFTVFPGDSVEIMECLEMPTGT